MLVCVFSVNFYNSFFCIAIYNTTLSNCDIINSTGSLVLNSIVC